jgi:hypothetical protein
MCWLRFAPRVWQAPGLLQSRKLLQLFMLSSTGWSMWPQQRR